MATVDDIDIAGASSGDVVEQLSAMLGVPVWELPDGSPCLRIGDHAQVTVYPDDDHVGQVVAEVRHAGSDEEQIALARRIYDHLAASTSWDLTLTSDVDPAFVVASRR